MKRESNTFFILDKKGVNKERVYQEDIKGLIERQTLERIESYEESIFLAGKLDKNFFTYLIIMLEDYYSVVFTDQMLEIENFDTINKIVQMIVKANTAS